MAAAKFRLTLASMWALEDIGVSEIQNQFKDTDPQLDVACEYSKADDVLVMKGGNLEASASKYASLMSDFIEEQKNKDLLDMPRIRQLEVPAVFDEEIDPVMDNGEKEQQGELVALNDDSDEELITLSINQTKFWLSASGGLGCFANGSHGILAEIATATGTEISIIDDTKGIQVSGKNQGDVDDALAKLSRIEKPLSLISNTNVQNMVIAPDDDKLRVRIQNYNSLNSVALRRILVEQNLGTNVTLCQMFVTVLLSFDAESQSWNLPGALANPGSISNEPGRSRIWNDFTFQEIGKGDDFLAMEAIVEKDPADPKAASAGIAPPHPFLTAEKAKLVNQWVVERGEIENEPAPEFSEPSQPTAPPKTPEPAPATKKPPGIRTRKAAQVAGKEKLPAAKPPSTEPEPAKSPISKPAEEDKASVSKPAEESTPPPRRKWKMVYSPTSNNPLTTSPDLASTLTPNMERTVGHSRNPSYSTEPRTPEKNEFVPPAFDPTKYGLKNRTPRPAEKNTGPGGRLLTTPTKAPGKRNALVDIFGGTMMKNANHHPPISFDQPALVPQKTSSSISESTKENLCQKEPTDAVKNSVDLLGLEFEKRTPSTSSGHQSIHDTKPSSGSNHLGAEERLSFLKKVLDEQKREVASAESAHASKSKRHVNQVLTKGRLEELEKVYKTEGKQSVDETATREFRRTMMHKTAKPSQKAKSKSEVKAKRQATLEDAWGMPKKPTKSPSAKAFAGVTVDSKPGEKIKEAVPKDEMAFPMKEKSSQDAECPLQMKKAIQNLFRALEPTLEAAEFFPGSLNLEVQLGLVLIPLLPKSYSEGRVSIDEWTRIFTPRNGLPAPTTKFINRLTTSGTDVDHLIDLKTSKAEGKRRLFEQEYTEYGVLYEYHCRTSTDQLLVVAIDEQGKYSIKQPTTLLGAANLHFPRQTWDASFVVSSVTEYATSSDQEPGDAVRQLIDNLWVQPDKPLLRIFTRLPKGNKLIIENIFMKRWTRHRYIQPGYAVLKSTTDEASLTARNCDSTVTASGDQNGVANNGDAVENQDLFLQITEVQDLFIGSCPSDPQAIRARCAGLQEMVRKNRQWYEASLVSPSIETILKSNSNIEVGERTDDWCNSDLLGHDASLLSENADSASSPSAPVSSVAAAIGVAGIGGLLRLTKTVVEKMDSIGFWNFGPGVDAARLIATAATGTLPLAGPLPGRPAASAVQPLTEPNGLEFDEIESVKESGSVILNAVDNGSVARSSAGGMGEDEQEFW